uniref:Uncharacterized protein n=1 Tax=Bombyx mori TaxID=7091 RepID=A0A8R2ANZ8_BOMMO|nr:uncharacterized protein LOC101739505 [Bombyx mori]
MPQTNGCQLRTKPRIILSSIDFYLSVIGNCLVFLGFVIGKINSDNQYTFFISNLLILLGHLVALMTELTTLYEDYLCLKNGKRDYEINSYFTFANILSILGEYKEMNFGMENYERDCGI